MQVLRLRCAQDDKFMERINGSLHSMQFASTHADISLLQYLSRDHHALNFAGAFSYGAQLYIAVELFRRIVLDEAVAAVNLDALIADPHRCLARKELCHR